MNKGLSGQDRYQSGLARVGIFSWVLMIIVLGVYFRNRPDDIRPGLDWVVMVQLVVSLLGWCIGILLIKRQPYLGFAGKSVLLFAATAAGSAIFSDYSTTVIGYWLLLSGMCLLTVGLVQHAQTMADLIRIEKAWLITTVLVLVINVTTSIAQSGLDPRYGGYARLGMGWVHASHLSYMSSLVFCVSFMNRELRKPVLLWTLRLFLLLVIVVSRNRIPLLICLISLSMQIGLKLEKASLGILISCLFGIASTGILLAASFDLPGASSLFDYMTRGDPGGMASLTGRTAIWTHAIKTLVEDPHRIIYGFGYGISRLILNINRIDVSFYYNHTHNDFLEVLLGMGLLSAVVYTILLLYSAKWLIGFRQRCVEFSTSFALRVFTVIVAFYITSIFEVPLGSKANPYAMLVILYICAADNKGYQKSDLNNGESLKDSRIRGEKDVERTHYGFGRS